MCYVLSYTNRKMNRFFRVRPSVTLPIHILDPNTGRKLPVEVLVPKAGLLYS
jgi:hypothetical protein